MPLIKDGRIVEDPWVAVGPGDGMPDGEAILVPLAVWRESRDTLLRRNARLGVRLNSDEPPELIADDIGRLDLIALEFPTFRDGRPYSHARVLRERYGYVGELRAVGNVLRDQLPFMHRCGFDAYEVSDPKALDGWRRTLSEISVVYQPAPDRVPTATELRRRASNVSPIY
jgi:uncharacterized protein (DUF934 family)